MRFLAVATAVAAALAVLATSLAEAQQPRSKSGQRATAAPSTVFISRDEQGRTRTRIIVQKRSYLDGGTEVLPGQRGYSNYHTQPFWTPTDILGPGRGYDRQPLNSRWELGGTTRIP
jgi:hypothetical protein